jgi:uncharacterized protein
LGQTSLRMNAALNSIDTVLIRGPALRRVLIAGARRLISQRDLLNKINVFPVADGDTGSNLAFTMGNVLTGALSRRVAHVGDLLKRVGDDAVDGARGNSGAILAQFFTGVAESIGSMRGANVSAMTQAIASGAQSARGALSDPREGTMISVMQAFAQALQQSMAHESPNAWFAHGLKHAKQALAFTPQQLPVLMKAGVVDAGAQGFVDLLEGIDDYLRSGQWHVVDQQMDTSADLEAAYAHGELDDQDPNHRYCSECLLIGEGLDRASLRAAVTDLGASCVVVAGSHSRLRLHAHVANPNALFDVAARFGRVESTKADDMHAQARTAKGGGEVVIVTDSSADIPDGLAEALNIHVVPLRLNFGDDDYLDKIGLSTSEFYRKLRTEIVLPKTSQPSPGDFRRQFEFLLSHHPALVYVGLSRAVSGTLQAAETAAQRGHSERIAVFDTANAATGQGLLVIAAAEAAQRGEPASSILALIEKLKPETYTWAIAREISHAVRGGRIPRWSKPVVEWLGITPMAKVSPQGSLKPFAAFFGKKNVPQRFVRKVLKQIDQSRRWRLMVGHCGAEEDGLELLRLLKASMQWEQAWCVETGPAVGAHAGPGALVISIQPVHGVE